MDKPLKRLYATSEIVVVATGVDSEAFNESRLDIESRMAVNDYLSRGDQMNTILAAPPAVANYDYNVNLMLDPVTGNNYDPDIMLHGALITLTHTNLNTQGTIQYTLSMLDVATGLVTTPVTNTTVQWTASSTRTKHSILHIFHSVQSRLAPAGPPAVAVGIDQILQRSYSLKNDTPPIEQSYKGDIFRFAILALAGGALQAVQVMPISAGTRAARVLREAIMSESALKDILSLNLVSQLGVN